MLELSPEVYAKEYYYMQRLWQKARDFDVLLKVLGKTLEAEEFLRSAYASAGDSSLLDGKKIRKLQRENPDLYTQIFPDYLAFLEERAGL